MFVSIGLNQDTDPFYEEMKSSLQRGKVLGVPNRGKAFGVTIDFLIGDGEFASFDKETVDRITSIQQLDQKTKSILFNLIDTYIQNFKTKQAFAK